MKLETHPGFSYYKSLHPPGPLERGSLQSAATVDGIKFKIMFLNKVISTDSVTSIYFLK